MGIPNLAIRGRDGQERQSRCMLAMPNLAIHLGYHQLAGPRQQVGGSRPCPSRGLSPVAASESHERCGIRHDELPMRSSVSYSYAQLL